jgi:hypothetical protein
MKKFLLSIYLLLTLPIFSTFGAGPAETVNHWVDYRVMPTYFGVPLVDTNLNLTTISNDVANLTVRVNTLEAQTNSYASLYSLNMLSNRVVTLESQTNSYASKSITNSINSLSNRIESVNTNLQGQITAEYQRATNAEYDLDLKIGITSNYFYNYSTNLGYLIDVNSNLTYQYFTNLSDQILINSNQTFLYYTNVLQLLYVETNRANSAETNLSARIDIETNRAISAETNLQGQVSSATNRIFALEGVTITINNVTSNIVDNPIFTIAGGGSNTLIEGTGFLIISDSGPTSYVYHVTSSGITNKLIESFNR